MVVESQTSIAVLVTEDDPIPERVFRHMENRFQDIAGDRIKLVAYHVCQDSFPERLEDHVGYIITGSHYCANDGFPWMDRLEALIVQIKEKPNLRLFAICFGHQMTARALGGRVARNPSGRFIWGCDRVEITNELAKKPFYTKASLSPTHFHVMQSHFDQVIETPSSARVVGGCDECPCEVIMYDDHILTMQGHPEMMASSMSEKLSTIVAKKYLNQNEANSAETSLQNEEGDDLMKMVTSFLLS